MMNGIGMGGGWLFGVLIAAGIVLLIILLRPPRRAEHAKAK